MILRKYKWHLFGVIFLLMLFLALLTTAEQKHSNKTNSKTSNTLDKLIRDYIDKPESEALIKQLQGVIDGIQTKLDNNDIQLNSDELLLRTLYDASSLKLKKAAVTSLCENPKYIDICVDAIKEEMSLRTLVIGALQYVPDGRVIVPLIEVLRNKEWESFHKDVAAALSFRAYEFPEEATQIIQSAHSLVKDPKVPGTAKFALIDKTLTMLTLERKNQQANQTLISIMRDEDIDYKLRFYAARALADSFSTEAAERREAARFCASYYESFTLSEPILDIKLFPYDITSRSFVEVGRGYAVRNLQFKPYAESAMAVIGEVRIPECKYKSQLTVQFAISLYDALGKYLGGEQFYVYGVHPEGGIYPFDVSIIGVTSKSVQSCQIRPQGVWVAAKDKQPSTGIPNLTVRRYQ